MLEKVGMHCTLFENHLKCLIRILQSWHFPSIFVQLKLTCLVTLFDRKLQVFKTRQKWQLLNETFCVIFKHRVVFAFMLHLFIDLTFIANLKHLIKIDCKAKERIMWTWNEVFAQNHEWREIQSGCDKKFFEIDWKEPRKSYYI